MRKVLFYLFCVAILLSLVIPGSTVLADGTWSPMTSGTTRSLIGVWGSSASDVFAVGGEGTILHYNGSAWSTMTSGTTQDLYGVWGSSASDIFAVGGKILGGGGAILLHYDGSAWSPMTSGAIDFLLSVWGSSASDVFAVGCNGDIVHYDGSAWSTMTSGITNILTGVWGSSASDVFAVGTGGTILRYDGLSWSPMTSSTTGLLNGVWGSSASDVFAVSMDGEILHYNGSAWSTMTSGTTQWLWSVWGSSASDVFAVGDSGTILHYTEEAPDSDSDGISDDDDNCPTTFNPDQYDSEQPPDGIGDVCDPDTLNSSDVSSNDGSISVCHESGAICFNGSTANPNRTVTIMEDTAGIGTIEVTTKGKNHVCNKFDILSSSLLTGTVTKVTDFPGGISQSKLDNMTVKKKVAGPDIDIPYTVVDTQPATAPYTLVTITFDIVDDATFVVLTPADSDSDGVYDQFDLNGDGDFNDPGELDNCPNTPNPDQADSDGDGIGDVCEGAEEEGGCFIATAAYGSYLDGHVETLREFRDSYMLTNPVGSALVSAYYKLSPPMADFIDDHPALKPIVRAGLMPAVAMSAVAVSTTSAEKVAILGGLALVSVALALWLRKQRTSHLLG